MRSKLIRFVCVGLLLALPVVLLGQGTTTVTISGQITDASGAAIPGATVTVTNVATSATRTATTSQAGSYAVPNLMAGTYIVKITKDGFQAAVIPNLQAGIGAQILQNAQLRVGSQSTEVQVTGAAPLLQTQQTEVSQQVSATAISQLPLTDRNITSIAALTVGATLPAVPGTAGQYGRRQSVVVVNGGRASSTNYVLDGIDIRDLRFNEMSLRPIVDSLSEVQVLSNSYSTEYGQGTAQVVSETKSGTNQLHGDVWEYVQNTALNARDFFNPVKTPQGVAVAKLPYHNNDYGFTVGGPIVKNRAFIFGGWEGIRTSSSSPAGEIVPTAAQLGGDLSGYGTTFVDPNPASPLFGQAITQVPSNEISPMAKLLAATVPTPNSACTGAFATDNYCGSSAFQDKNDNVTVRSDVTLNSKNSMFVRYIWNRGYQYTYGLALPAYSEPNTSPDLATNIALGETWAISPTLVNTFNLGYNRVSLLPFTPDPQGKNWVTAAGLQNITGSIIDKLKGMPSNNIGGTGGASIKNPANPAFGSNFANVGGIGGIFQGGLNNVYSLGEKLTKVAGSQTIEMGIQIQDRRFLQNTNLSNTGAFGYNGSFSGNALADFLFGYCSSCSGSIGDTTGWYHDKTVSPFINDVWQVTPNLTATLGMRYDYQGVFLRNDGLQANFDPKSQQVAFHTVPASASFPVYAQYMNTTPNFYPAGIIKPDYNDFEPRVGLVYRIGNNTVIHAGSMMSHENTNLNELQFTTNLAPLYVTYRYSPSMPSTCGTNGKTQCTVADYSANTGVQAGIAQAQMYPNLVASGSSASQFFLSPSQLTSFPGGFPAPFAVDAGNRLPYTIQWNLSIQQMLPHQILFDIAYEGSVSHKLWKRWDQNQQICMASITGTNSAPQCSGASSPYPSTNTTVRPYMQFASQMLTSSNMANANFNGLAVSLQRRYSDGLFFLGNFQWSRSIDNNSGEADANDTAFRTNFNADRAASNFNQNLRGNISLTYQPQLHNVALRNWQATSVITLDSGLPYTPSTNGVCNCGFAPSRANPVAGVSPVLANPTIAAWFNKAAFVDPAKGTNGIVDRNSLIGPGLAQVDFGLNRSFGLGETRSLQLRADVTNLLNHPNFMSPNTNVDASNAATITSDRQMREVKLGLRLSF